MNKQTNKQETPFEDEEGNLCIMTECGCAGDGLSSGGIRSTPAGHRRGGREAVMAKKVSFKAPALRGRAFYEGDSSVVPLLSRNLDSFWTLKAVCLDL